MPAAGEAIEDQAHRFLAHAAPAPGTGDEEFSHAELDGVPSGLRPAAADHGEAHRLVILEYGEQLRVGVGEPAGELVGLAMAELTQGREYTRAQRREVIQVIAVDRFHPPPVIARASGIADTDRHALKHESPCRPVHGLRGLSCQTR